MVVSNVDIYQLPRTKYHAPFTNYRLPIPNPPPLFTVCEENRKVTHEVQGKNEKGVRVSLLYVEGKIFS